MVVHGSRMGKAPVTGALFWWLFKDKDKPTETDCAWPYKPVVTKSDVRKDEQQQRQVKLIRDA